MFLFVHIQSFFYDELRDNNAQDGQNKTGFACVLRAACVVEWRWRTFGKVKMAKLDLHFEANPRWRGGAVWVFCDVFGSLCILRCAKLLGNSWEHEYMELGPSTCVLLPTLVLICQNCYTCRSARQRSLRSCKWDLPRCLRGLRAHAHQAAMVAPTPITCNIQVFRHWKITKNAKHFCCKKLPK